MGHYSYDAVQFLDVYYPSSEEREDAKLYSRNVQQLVAK